MRLFLFFMLIVICQVNAQNVSKYQWKNRVVLLFAKDSESIAIKKQLKAFEEQKAATEERDMVILTAKPMLKTQLGLKPDFEGIVLIGKDGGVKFSENFFVKPQTLFALIDKMPMRKTEMRRKKG